MHPRQVSRETAFIGLALDGTSGRRCHAQRCPLCHPFRNQQKEVTGYHIIGR